VPLAAALLVLAALGIGAFFYFAAPGLIVSDKRIAGKTGDALKQEEQRLKARNDARTAGVQLIGVLGLVVGSLLTWRTVRLTREGQITDRFAAAVENLDGDKAQSTQLGAVYALERIARDSRRDHWPVMEILVGYLHEQADPAPDPKERGSYTVKPQVQAVARVLGRRRARWDGDDNEISLAGLDLRNIRLPDADLRRANLSESNLSGAFLERANLDGATLRKTVLRGAHLDGARAHGATIGADFTGARLDGVDFRDATYKRATFAPATAAKARGLPPGVD
jgi:hypothetical protein